MQISSFLATVLLAVPALVAAAPVTSGTSVNTSADIFTRDATCNAVISSDPTRAAEQRRYLAQMNALTPQYHAAESRCPSNALVTYAMKKTSPAAKAALKQRCLDGYNQCVTLRQQARQACINAGGRPDAGHDQAIAVCRQKANTWRTK